MHGHGFRPGGGRGGRGEWGGRGPGGGGRGGQGRRGGPPLADLPSADDAAAWFTGRLPDGWFTGAPEVSVDREEILVVGELAPLEAGPEGGDTPAAQSAAEAGRISRFREETREARIEIAQQAEHRYGRKVAWGARLGGSTELFTTVAVPVMTRLRQPERQVLDTLVDSGVARSRSEALAWAVRLVGEHAEEWLGELREAMKAVEEVRGKGPELS
jgi:Arc/MetJ-type ribon-helix-helix transcriptional regulator